MSVTQQSNNDKAFIICSILLNSTIIYSDSMIYITGCSESSQRFSINGIVIDGNIYSKHYADTKHIEQHRIYKIFPEVKLWLHPIFKTRSIIYVT